MTVIAWDGKTLAADKRAVNCGFKGGTVTKIHRWKDGLCAFAGDFDVGMQMVAWLRDGAVAKDYPKKQEDNACSFMVVYSDGRVARYESTPVPLPFENTVHAMGSGRDYALAAMHLGKNAAEAVAVACALDSGCGNGIDVLFPVEARDGETGCTGCGRPLSADEKTFYGHTCEVCEGAALAIAT